MIQFKLQNDKAGAFLLTDLTLLDGEGEPSKLKKEVYLRATRKVISKKYTNLVNIFSFSIVWCKHYDPYFIEENTETQKLTYLFEII